jgi:hypothetical protein
MARPRRLTAARRGVRRVFLLPEADPVLVFDRDSWQRNRGCALVCGLLALAALAAYFLSCLVAGRWLGGSSVVGFPCGLAAGALVVYECALALRKVKGKYAVWNRRPALDRLRWHVWLGLLCLPLALIHGGPLTRGGPLALALLGVFLLVILSGVVGLVLQQWLPRRLLQEVPDETIPSEIAALGDQLAGEAELLVLAACGPGEEDGAALGGNVEWVRAHRHAHGAGLLENLPSEPIADTGVLRRYFRTTIGPFLRHGRAAGSPLTARRRAEDEFRDLRGRVNPAAHPIVDLLERLCDRRRQLDHQARLAYFLSAWVTVHLVLSAVLLVLLIWHTVTAIIYW